AEGGISFLLDGIRAVGCPGSIRLDIQDPSLDVTLVIAVKEDARAVDIAVHCIPGAVSADGGLGACRQDGKAASCNQEYDENTSRDAHCDRLFLNTTGIFDPFI